LLQDRLHINRIPEHNHVDDQPERTELIFLSFAVGGAPFKMTAAKVRLAMAAMEQKETKGPTCAAN
jgi:hypothetical protein